jgi:hypothetical protein
MTRNHAFLNDILLEAKRGYLAAEAENISIYASDSWVPVEFYTILKMKVNLSMAQTQWLESRRVEAKTASSIYRLRTGYQRFVNRRCKRFPWK